MDFLGFILIVFLGICLVVGCKRACRVIVKGINHLFDWIEGRIDKKDEKIG